MASKFHDKGLEKLMSPVITSTNYVDFAIGNTTPVIITSDTDSHYRSHTVAQLGISKDSTVTNGVAYKNNTTVFYFDAVSGEGASVSHTGDNNLKWVIIRTSSTTLFEIKLANLGGLNVDGPSGDTPGNQVKLGAYTSAGSGRGIYIKLSSVAV